MRIKSIYWNFGQNKPEKFFRYIDTSSIDRKKNIINYKNLQYLSPEQAPSRARKLVSQNSVLFSTVRPYLKNIAVVRELKEYLIASTAFIVLDTLLNETYLKYYLLSDNFINRVNNKSTGTSYPAINDYNFNLLLIAIPPLAEQQRIVEVIESALEKVDEYAESYNRLEQLDKEFPDKLKKSILQYAMQGKLVEQDPNDESVEVLLEKIRAEKQKLFEEGKIKKKDLEISIVSQGDDNSYYKQLPRNWMLSTLDSVSNLYTGNSINSTEKKKYFSGVDGINYIATKDVNFDNTINYDNGIRIPDNYLSKFKISYFNSVLLCLEGGSAGRKIGLLKQDVCFGNKLCNLSFYYGENKFLYYFLQSPQFLSDFQKNKSGIIGGVSKNNLGNILIPVLPRNEQMRITQGIDLLFQKVSQLSE
ncbi:type I restriction-modification system M protein [Streptococcus infantis]|nr:restriction endonuclease subunit S [Streptococcus infantis]SUN83143.1 type I restriction-modification system M protein [Streptococcus infantis]